MTAAMLLDQVSAYAAAVRAHLADLGPEQVDDLTDDLEANLTDALTDGLATGDDDGAPTVGLARRFGPPADYATELRAAAGLGARAPGRRRLFGPRGGVRARVLTLRARVGASRYGPGLAALRESARPLWWVIRGWLWYVALMAFTQASMGQPYLPRTGVAWLGLGVLVVASIHLGRGWRGTSPWVRRVGIALTVVAVLFLPWATSGVRGLISAAAGDGGEGASDRSPENGVWIDGRQVRNLFAYDAEGNLLSAVQLFDETGRPVHTVDGAALDPYGPFFDAPYGPFFDAAEPDPWLATSATDVFGGQRWNVFPLTGAPASQWRWDDDGRLVLPEGVEATTPPAPFAKATAVLVAEPPATDGAAPDPTPESAPAPEPSPADPGPAAP